MSMHFTAFHFLTNPNQKDKSFDSIYASIVLTELGNFGEFSNSIHAPGYFYICYSMQRRPNSFPGLDRVPCRVGCSRRSGYGLHAERGRAT